MTDEEGRFELDPEPSPPFDLVVLGSHGALLGREGPGGTYHMTILDYNLVMAGVQIAQLKARLSEYLRQVRRGESITVLDRDKPVARLIPYESDLHGLRVRRAPPGARLGDVAVPPPLDLGFDVVDLLLEERQSHR